MTTRPWNRREFGAVAIGTTLGVTLAQAETDEASWRPKFMLASSLYGKASIGDVVSEARKCGAAHVDLWALPHGDQRHQIDSIGPDALARLLEEHQMQIGALTRFDLGPFGLSDEIAVADRLGAPLIICGSGGRGGLGGAELKAAVQDFSERIRPHVDAAAEAQVTIAIETHSRMLICSRDSLRWLMDFVPENSLGVAVAPYHLPQDPGLICELVADLGERLHLFYAWQHGKGCMTPQPKSDELLQLPGRGHLDFSPIMTALASHRYGGLIEVFMHPFPRGEPILATNGEVTDAIVAAQDYLLGCIKEGE